MFRDLKKNGFVKLDVERIIIRDNLFITYKLKELQKTRAVKGSHSKNSDVI